ncbi:MAG: hypothetical protein IT373_08350 [Polyangiaceae bacterium]|nr:hypothetical protein [Polyangiaceae bacterium]
MDRGQAHLADAPEVCMLVSPEAVAASFVSGAALRTAPMGEANGPACGYPDPDRGGYLLVIQRRSLASWDTADTTGTPIADLGVAARLDEDAGNGSASLFVRDEPRHAVMMFLAPSGPPAALLRVAGHLYHR